MQRYLLVLFWALCTLLWSPWSLAQDHIVERSYLEDASGGLSWPEVKSLPTTPFSGALSRGFGSSVIWIKLRIDPTLHPTPQREPERLVLRIRPVYLDDIQVFDPLTAIGLAGVTGDVHHPRLDEIESLDFTLPLVRGNSPREVWLRLTSTSTRQIDVQALNVSDLNRITHRQALVFAGYIGLVLVIAVWALVYWAFSRDQLIGAFGLAQTNAFLYALASLGYLRSVWPLSWPAWPLDTVSTVLSITAVSSAVFFHVVFIKELDPPSSLKKTHLVMLGLLPLKVVLLSVGLTTLALEINLVEVLLSPAVFLLSVWKAQGWHLDKAHQPVLSRRVMLGFYGLLLAMLAIAALPGLGLLSRSGDVALYIVQTHGLITGFLIMLMLQYRAHRLNQRQQETALELERTQLQVRQERKLQEEQAQLLAMLAHEIKTPLATMLMVLDPQHRSTTRIKQAIHDMNGVIDRCLQTAQLNDSQLQPHYSQVDMVQLLSDAVSACTRPERVQIQAPGQLLLRTDRQLMFIVLSNLLENGCKYAEPDTVIEVVLEVVSERGPVRIEIRNRPGAAGWPDADKVFQKYFRSPLAKRQSGTGLGLYLTRNLVQTLKGRIQYMPDQEWVRFVVWLPSHA